MKKQILYICDKKKNCKNKNCAWCGYTTDIKHAINFNKKEGIKDKVFYIEQEKDIKVLIKEAIYEVAKDLVNGRG